MKYARKCKGRVFQIFDLMRFIFVVVLASSAASSTISSIESVQRAIKHLLGQGSSLIEYSDRKYKTIADGPSYTSLGFETLNRFVRGCNRENELSMVQDAVKRHWFSFISRIKADVMCSSISEEIEWQRQKVSVFKDLQSKLLQRQKNATAQTVELLRRHRWEMEEREVDALIFEERILSNGLFEKNETEHQHFTAG